MPSARSTQGLIRIVRASDTTRQRGTTAGTDRPAGGITGLARRGDVPASRRRATIPGKATECKTPQQAPSGTSRPIPSRSTDSLRAILDPSMAPLFWHSERIGTPSAWWQHVPFAHWLVLETAPRLLVELGTQAGVSYSAFCDAVLRGGLPTRCHAVDTWRGDEHAGAYGPAVYEEFRCFHDARYQGFSTLLRCTFDDALGTIADNSIDLAAYRRLAHLRGRLARLSELVAEAVGARGCPLSRHQRAARRFRCVAVVGGAHQAVSRLRFPPRPRAGRYSPSANTRPGRSRRCVGCPIPLNRHQFAVASRHWASVWRLKPTS